MGRLHYIIVGLFLMAGCLFQACKHTKHAISEETEMLQYLTVYPEFPGGEEARQKYLTDSLIYPELAREVGIEGTVTVSFVIDTNGSVIDVEVVRSVHELLDAEAIRVTQSMPKWSPGKQGGRLVRTHYRQPIKFTLTNEAND